eukprot:CAMPEP_0172620462 /NCGR_PEP_ID=MMETSP1068-20121228/103492_1 /TAXON_ID=35684 /ORGANISM="Pseudopedinella elastica, Strain CCMP716" /LENGTH=235 /DNA_ID=CAMNT_0013427719 /DNA_START=224 /DNA_END=928 /DNA_ORIENTATION=+
MLLHVCGGFLLTPRHFRVQMLTRSSEEGADEGESCAPLGTDVSSLESLFSLQVSESDLEDASEFIDSAAANQTRVSSTRRRRTEKEKTLIKQLAKEPYDEAATLLWKHWYSERGGGPRNKLIELENYIASNNPLMLLKAETTLNELIQEYPDWAEPYNRLGIIRYIQRRYEDSAVFCEKVLKMKPWHFGARSGLAMCRQKQGRLDLAKSEAELSLPPPGKYKDKKGKVFEPRKAW